MSEVRAQVLQRCRGIAALQRRLLREAVWLDRIFRNSVILLAGTIFINLVSIPFIAFLARALGTERFGVYSVAFAFADIFLIFIDMAASALLTREVSANEAHGAVIIGALVAPKPILLVIALSGGVLLSWALAYSSLERAAMILGIGIAAMMAMATTARAVFHAHQRMEYDLVGQFTERGVTIAGAVVAVQLRAGVLGVMAAAVLGNLVDALISWLLVRRSFVSGPYPRNQTLAGKYLRSSLPIFVSAFLYALYLRAPVIITGRLLGNSAAGWYNAALQIVGVVLWLPRAVGMSVLAPFSQAVSEGKPAFRQAYFHLTGAMALMGLLLAVCVAWTAAWTIPALYSERFVPSVGVLRTLAVALPFTFASSVLGQVLLATNRQSTMMRAVMVAATICVAITLFTAQSFGIAGVAYAAVATEVVLLGQYLIAIVWPGQKAKGLFDPAACADWET